MRTGSEGGEDVSVRVYHLDRREGGQVRVDGQHEAGLVRRPALLRQLERVRGKESRSERSKRGT